MIFVMHLSRKIENLQFVGFDDRQTAADFDDLEIEFSVVINGFQFVFIDRDPENRAFSGRIKLFGRKKNEYEKTDYTCTNGCKF